MVFFIIADLQQMFLVGSIILPTRICFDYTHNTRVGKVAYTRGVTLNRRGKTEARKANGALRDAAKILYPRFI